MDIQRSTAPQRMSTVVMRVTWCLLTIVMAPAAFGGPFGLSMGMPKEQIPGVERMDTPLTYQTKQPPQPSTQFETYLLRIGDKSGLCMVTAVSKAVSTNRYGVELKEEYESIREILAEKYGPYTKRDFLLSGSIWDEPEDFMVGLTKNERYLRTYWDENAKSTLPEEIRAIALTAAGLSSESGVVYIRYEFTNFDACANEAKEIDASVL